MINKRYIIYNIFIVKALFIFYFSSKETWRLGVPQSLIELPFFPYLKVNEI